MLIDNHTDTSQGLARGMAHMQFGPPQEHMRRGSTQSVHSDVGNQGLPTGPGRGGYGGPQGRGRGYNPSYNPQISYSPSHNFRPRTTAAIFKVATLVVASSSPILDRPQWAPAALLSCTHNPEHQTWAKYT